MSRKGSFTTRASHGIYENPREGGRFLCLVKRLLHFHLFRRRSKGSGFEWTMLQDSDLFKSCYRWPEKAGKAIKLLYLKFVVLSLPNWFPYPLLSFDKFIKLCYCKLHVGPAARFVKNCCEREPGTVTNLLNDLKWNSVELRRKIARLATMYKKVNNKTKVNIPEYIARPTGVKRSYHSSKFINIGSNSNTCKHNFCY